MANTKIQKEFVDHGCGFPVVLKNVPMVQVRGVWTPQINYDVLHKNVIRALAYKLTRLTGNEIKFIRLYFELTLIEFGDFFDVSHPAVLKWENAGDDTPSIKWSLERDLRMFIMDRISEDPAELGKLYGILHSKAKQPRSKRLNLASLKSIIPKGVKSDHKQTASN